MARSKASHDTPADTSIAVDAFMATLDHEFKADIELLRKAILAIDPSVAEGIKWNAPSFRTTEYFATMNLRAKSGLGLVLHLGAKAKDLPDGGIVVRDPGNLLKWLGKDRALVAFDSSRKIAEAIPGLQAVLRQWITYV